MLSLSVSGGGDHDPTERLDERKRVGIQGRCRLNPIVGKLPWCAQQ